MQHMSHFEKLIFDLRATNGKIEKQRILLECGMGTSMDLMQIVLDPFQKFNVTAEGLAKTPLKGYPTGCNFPVPETVKNLIVFLKKLATREISGGDAKQICLHTIQKFKGFEGILINIFDKDLKMGMGAKEVNKVYKNWIPTFDVQLATKTATKSDPELLAKTMAKVNAEPHLWTIQRKLDGVRLLITCENGVFTCHSRYGNVFSSLAKLQEALKDVIPRGANIVLDGELCVVDENGNEDFNAAVSEIKRKNITMQKPKFIVFDCIPLGDFRRGVCQQDYRARYMFLMNLVRKNPSEYITLLKSFRYSEENFAKMMDTAEKAKWEGLILRKNAIYRGKRTTDMYKVKRFFVEEFVIDSVNNAVMEMYDPVTKIKRPEETMKSVNIIHKGNIVNVGSGWSADERRVYYKEPEKLIGRTLSVQFQEHSEDKEGNPSLRIPTVKKLWEKERDV